jgi:hypothetical protein
MLHTVVTASSSGGWSNASTIRNQQFILQENSERLSCGDARCYDPSRTMPKRAKNEVNECRSLPTDISKALTSTLGCGQLPRDEHLYFNVVLRRLGH